MAWVGEGDFFGKLKVEEEGGCVLWTGARNGAGHGILRRKGKNYRAHRFAWEMVNGPLADTQQLRRTCERLDCVNPNHMRLVEFEMTESRLRSRAPKGSAPTKPVTSPMVRFMALTKEGPEVRPGLGPCLEWTGGTVTTGYGTFYDRRVNKCVLAHRISYELHYGNPIPAHLLGCHRCDNVRCVRPEHIFIGTHQDNSLDMHAKGRAPDFRGRKRKPEHIVRGADSGNAKLTESQVYEIRSSPETQKDIARRFGVGQSVVSAIRTRKSWKHLPERSANTNVQADSTETKAAC